MSCLSIIRRSFEKGRRKKKQSASAFFSLFESVYVIDYSHLSSLLLHVMSNQSRLFILFQQIIHEFSCYLQESGKKEEVFIFHFFTYHIPPSYRIFSFCFPPFFLRSSMDSNTYMCIYTLIQIVIILSIPNLVYLTQQRPEKLALGKFIVIAPFFFFFSFPFSFLCIITVGTIHRYYPNIQRSTSVLGTHR